VCFTRQHGDNVFVDKIAAVDDVIAPNNLVAPVVYQATLESSLVLPPLYLHALPPDTTIRTVVGGYVDQVLVQHMSRINLWIPFRHFKVLPLLW
jgi:hypothetical protein